MTLQGKTVLVTGGTGFIGGRLVEKLVLEQRARVRVLVRNFVRAARISRFPVEIISGDITDTESVRRAVQGCEVVFHCAYDFGGTRDTQKKAGIEGTHGLAETVLGSGVARLVHVSTFMVYAPMSGGDLTESSPWPDSDNPYVRIKRASERLLLKMHRNQGLPVAVIQPSLVYGPYSPHWTVEPIKKLRTGIMPLVEEGSGYCNAVYVDDVVDALILAAARPDAVGEAFLISGERPVTWKDFYGAYEGALGVQATAPMTAGELREERKRQRKKYSLPHRLKNAVQTPEIASLLAGLPLVPTALRTTRRVLSDEQWTSLKVWFLQGGMQNHAENGSPSKTVHVPDEALLSLYQSRTRVRIDKARERLGYAPKFSFERGMDITAQFIRWANL